jgi:hypothetical protein
LDTNVLIYAGDRASPFHHWAADLIAEAVAGGEGACANAVSLAEVCVGDADPAGGSVSVTATDQVVTRASRTLDHVTTPQFGVDFTGEAVRPAAFSVLKSGANLRLDWDSQSGPTYQALHEDTP